MIELAVVGGGPAGLAAAIHAARSGVEATVFEEHPQIGIPPHCAGIVSKDDLEKTGFYPPTSVVQAMVEHVTAVYEEHIFELPLKRKFLVLDRPLFDQHLSKMAEKEGCTIELASKVVGVHRDGSYLSLKVQRGSCIEEVRCKLAVAADGTASRIAYMLGLDIRREFAACIQYEVTPNPFEKNNIIEIYLGSLHAPGGYAWIVPAGDKAKIGLGVRNSPKPAKYFLDKLVKHRIPQASILKVMVHPVPVSGPIPKTYTSNLLVVGDAAGHVVPSSGAGIVPALICGRIAGEVAAKAVLGNAYHSEEFLAQYEMLWRKAIGRKFETAMALRRLAEEMPKEDRELVAKLLKGKLGHYIKTGQKVKALLYILFKHPHLLKYAKATIEASRYGLF